MNLTAVTEFPLRQFVDSFTDCIVDSIKIIFVLTMLQHCIIIYAKEVIKMAQTTVSFRMDEELKHNFDELCETLGMTMSTAFIVYAKQMLRERRIPFEISADPFFSNENTKAIRESIAQLSSGKTVTKTIQDLESIANG